ncbi:MAG TPA: tetratricopeptide repeat protein [Oculatellaceae cyanobacterium]
MGALAIRAQFRELWWLTAAMLLVSALLSVQFSSVCSKAQALVWYRKGIRAFQRDDYGAAETCWHIALKKSPYPHDGDLQYALIEDWLGCSLSRRGLWDQAKDCYQEALSIQTRGTDHESLDVARSMNGLGYVYKEEGNCIESENCYRIALNIRQSRLGSHQDTATSLNNLAGLYVMLHRFKDAEPLLNKALDMDRKLLGARSEVVLKLEGNLAQLKEETGELFQAQHSYERILAEMQDSQRNPSASFIAECLNNLGVTYQLEGRLVDAERSCRRAIDISKAIYGINSPTTADYMSNLAGILVDEGRRSEARDLYRLAIDIDTVSLKTGHPITELIKSNLAHLYVRTH